MAARNIITNGHYDLFKQYFREFQKKFGLFAWDIRFCLEEDEDFYAQCSIDYEGRIASITLSSKWDKPITEDWLRWCARHEALELLEARLRTLAQRRYVTQSEISEANHEIVRLLEHILDEAGIK
jgi:hypothetical protein